MEKLNADHFSLSYSLQVDQLREAVRNLKSEQNRLTGEIEREREERERWVLSAGMMCTYWA